MENSREGGSPDFQDPQVQDRDPIYIFTGFIEFLYILRGLLNKGVNMGIEKTEEVPFYDKEIELLIHVPEIKENHTVY